MLKLKQSIDDLDEYMIGYENLMCSAPINTEINIIDAKIAKNKKNLPEAKVILAMSAMFVAVQQL